MTQDKFLPYAKQSIDESDIQAVSQSLRQELITRGPKTAEFEQALALRFGAKWAIVFTSATTALYAAFQAAKVSSFDRFITTPNSFIATVAAGMRLGARPTFIDIDRQSGNLRLDLLKETLQQPLSRGRFVICPVHFSGIALDIKAIDSMLKTPEAIIIEDAAHAIGSCYPDGTVVGSSAYSQMTVFSFHAIKTLTTGEGGCVTTNDDELYRSLQCIRNSGIVRDAQYLTQYEAAPWYYEVQEISANYHMTEMQAALGLSQLNRLDSFIEKRRQIVSWYRHYLADMPEVKLFDASFDKRSTYHLFCVQIAFEKFGLNRTALMQALREMGIGTQYHYIPLYRHPALMKLYGDQSANFEQMEAYYSQALSLPLYVDLEESDIVRICRSLKKVLNPSGSLSR